MSATDVFRMIRSADAATLRRIVDRLEMRGRDATFGRFRQAYVEALRVSPGQRCLDLGCGTGVTTRLLHAASPDVHTVGVDHSDTLIEAARQFAREAGLEARSTYQVASVEALPFEDRSFDRVVADTLLAHVPDAERVLAEACRVLRPGGMLVVFDGDYGSLAFTGPDERLGEEIVQAFRKLVYTRPTVVRELVQLIPKSGLTLEATLANVYADIGRGGFFWSFAQTYTPLVASSGLVPEERVQRWFADQRRASEENRFFAACNYYAFVAQRVV